MPKDPFLDPLEFDSYFDPCVLALTLAAFAVGGFVGTLLRWGYSL